ncbi:MAG: hypothetical protein CMF70_00495 [Magnetovibrio sp.]|nr:hypothetical protein [Magnetovibrio sp.]
MVSKFFTPTAAKFFSKHSRYVSVTVLTFTVLFFAVSFLKANELQTQLFVSHIQGGKVVENKTVARVTEGQTVELHWTSDKDLELHLHGYDILLKLKKRF